VDVRVRLISGSHVQVKPVVELYCQNGGYHQCLGTEALNYRVYSSGKGLGAYANYGCGFTSGTACSSSGRNVALGMQVDDTTVPQCADGGHGALVQINGAIKIEEAQSGGNALYTRAGYQPSGAGYCVATIFGG
jgi:hypothetical protein